MKKWVYIISVVVVLVVLCCAYYITGVRAEREFNRFLEASKNFPGVTIKADNYQRGWLRSSVHINAVVHQPAQVYTQDGEKKIFPAQDVSFSFNTHIYHGPIILANHGVSLGLGYAEAEIPLPDEAMNQFSQIFTENSVKPTVVVSLLLKYRSRLNVGFDVPAFELTSKDGLTHLNWKGFTSYWKLYNKLEHTKGKVDFNGALYEDPASKGEVGPMSLKYDVANVNGEVLSGEASLNMDSLQFATEGQLPLLVEGFQIMSSNHVDNSLVDSLLKADVSKVTFHGKDYGPGVLNLAAHKLDAKTLGQIQEQLQSLNDSDLTSTQQRILLLTIVPELPALLEKGAELEMKQFQLSTSQGLILAMAKIKVPEQKEHTKNPLFLLNQLDAEASAEVPVAWLDEVTTDLLRLKIQQRQLSKTEMAAKADQSGAPNKPVKLLSEQEIDIMAHQQADEQLSSLVENEILLKKDNLYKIKMTFKNGAFTVNDKPFTGNAIQ